MQCECNVIILRMSDSIDNWNDKPKHPIIANGANKYLTSGEIMTVKKNVTKNLKIEISYFPAFFPQKIQE